MEENAKVPVFTNPKQYRLNYSQRYLTDIFSKAYTFGLDLNPEYQRGNVWEMGDKIKLLDSIFNTIDIGKFVFIRLPTKSGCPGYEVLDGKQRVTTILDFYENRFKYNGLFFNELSRIDQHHFKNYTISSASLDNPSLQEKLEYFLRLNTGGKLVDQKHLDRIEKTLVELQNVEN